MNYHTTILRREKAIQLGKPESKEVYAKLKRLDQYPAINTASNRFKTYVKGPRSGVDEKLVRYCTFDAIRDGGPEQDIVFRPHWDLYTFPIIEKRGTAEPRWVERWEASGVRFKAASEYYENFGHVEIRYAQSKKKKTITVQLPYQFISPEELKNIESFRACKAQDVANWLGRKFGYICGLGRVSRQLMIGIPVVDKDIERTVRKSGILQLPNGEHVDESVGTTELDVGVKKAVELSECPNEIRKLWAEHAAVKNTVRTIQTTLDMFRGDLKTITRKLDEHSAILSQIKNGMAGLPTAIKDALLQEQTYKPPASKDNMGYG